VVGQVRIELEGDGETLTRLEAALDRKLMRGGG
jgi:hypothetical protein